MLQDSVQTLSNSTAQVPCWFSGSEWVLWMNHGTDKDIRTGSQGFLKMGLSETCQLGGAQWRRLGPVPESVLTVCLLTRVRPGVLTFLVPL